MFFILLVIVISTAAAITGFLLATGDIATLRKLINGNKKLTFPIVTRSGDIVDSKEELDSRLEALRIKLEEKKSALEIARSRITTTVESMEKLNNTSAEIRRYYLQLKSEIAKSEVDCSDLQSQIDDYQKKQQDLHQEIRKNDGYYKNVLRELKLFDATHSSRPSSVMTMSTISMSN